MKQALGGRLFATALASTLAGSCSRAETARAVTSSVRDSADIHIVESRAPAWSAAEAWSVAQSPSLSIGAVDSAPQYELTNVRGIAELSDGRIAVANLGSLEIRCYRRDGSFLWASGHRGQGPGDFSTITRLSRYRADSLLVHDFGLRRYSVIDPSGKYVRSWAPDLPDGVTFSGSLSFAGIWDDGSIAILARPVRSGMSPPQVTRRPTRLFRYSPTGKVLADLGAFPGAEFYEGLGYVGSIRPLPFARNSVFATADNQTFVGITDAFEIRRLRGDGTLEQLIRRALPVRPVTPAEAAAERDRLRATRRVERPKFFRGMPDSMLAALSAGEEKTFDELPFPPSYPAYADILVARDGYLWVQEFTPDVDMDSTGHRWSIFHPDGRWLGDVRLPPRFTLYEATSEHVLGVQTDELDVPYIRAFQIRKDGRRDDQRVRAK
jgi:hypothetical protein